MDRRVISGSIDTVFEFDYSVQAEDMRSLYEKAKRDQWNATRDIAWATPEPGDGRVLADELIDIHGSPLWEKLSERDRVELNRRITAWRLSVLVYGEQGAMLACSQLVDIVPGTDEKFFQATQVMDEARHNEVLERYIQTRLGGLHYPMPENERFLFDAILTDPRWYIKTIALQLVAETFAVSMFKMMAEAAVDPVLGEVCRRILLDESRHMGFGMLALPKIVREATEGERREMEDFTCLAVEKVLRGAGLRLLVPDQHWDKVLRFVNDTDMRGRLQLHHVRAKLLGRILDAGQCLGCIEPVDGRVALRVVQGREHLDQRDHGIGRRPAEHPGVHRASERMEPDVHARHAAQGRCQGGNPDCEVAGVDDEDRVGAQQLDVLRHECLQPAGALFLRALADQLDAAREAAGDLLERPQCREVHDDVALAVGSTAAVPAPVALGELEHRHFPRVLAERRLDVIVAVQQHGRRALWRRRVAVHAMRAVRRQRHPDVLQPGGGP